MNVSHNRSEGGRTNLPNNVPRIQYSAEPMRKSSKSLKSHKKKLGVELRSCEFSKIKAFYEEKNNEAYNSNHLRSMYCANPSKQKVLIFNRFLQINKSCKGSSENSYPKDSKNLQNTYSSYLENSLGKALRTGLRYAPQSDLLPNLS